MSAAAGSAAGPDEKAGPVLQLADLRVGYEVDGTTSDVVHGVSLSVSPGEVVALVGESGSGKTTTGQSVIGLLPGNGRITGGRVLLHGEDITDWSDRRMDAVRGARVGLVPQDPHHALDPVRRVGDSLAEVLKVHGARDRRAVRARVRELLERVGLPDPELRARQYPHELSGGMKQRVLIAAAIALGPDLIIADEATSALDVTVQRSILDLIDELRATEGLAVLLITHDLGVALERADRVVVMQGGQVQEEGSTAQVFARPEADYTRRLLADSLPGDDVAAAPVTGSSEPVIEVAGLVQEFRLPGRREPFRAVDDVSFTVPRGSTHALVGESGSGKTTIARAVLGFRRPTAGRVLVDGVDVGTARRGELRALRQRLQLVYQNPFGSLDPRQRVGAIIAEPLLNFGRVDRTRRQEVVAELLDAVALPADAARRRPSELSGGQRQRVAIARALVLEPEVLVLDEATSALDVTVQAQILRLLQRLQVERGLTYLVISHDLAVVRRIAHGVTVLSRGRVVESGPTAQVLGSPRQPYTRALVDAIPAGYPSGGREDA